MHVRAHLRYLHIAPRKVRLVIGVVRGLPAERAVEQLSVLSKESARPIRKLIESAMANAEHNFKLDRKDLYIKTIVANEGPKLKRYRPRAFGRAAEILKRMTHVTVVLEDRAKTPQPTKVKGRKGETAPMVETETIKHPAAVEPKPAKAKTLKPVDPTPKATRRSAEDKTVARKGTS